MSQQFSRRDFVAATGGAMAGLALGSLATREAAAEDKPAGKKPLYKISLGEYSLHRMLRGKLDHLDFAKYTKDEFGIEAVE